MDFETSIYQTTGKAKPGRAFVAIIERPGKLGPHMASFTFAPTEEEAERKAAAAIESWVNPAKKSKQPDDLDTLESFP